LFSSQKLDPEFRTSTAEQGVVQVGHARASDWTHIILCAFWQTGFGFWGSLPAPYWGP